MDIIKAILALDSDAQVSVNAESLDQITWHDGNPNNITNDQILAKQAELKTCLLYTSPSPRDKRQSRMPSSA